MMMMMMTFFLTVTVFLTLLRHFIYLFIYFQNLGCNHTTAKAENTIQYMHTWILKDKYVAT